MITSPTRRVQLPQHRTAQRGVVLFISLIVLVAMTLAGIALWRQVGTGMLIVGNLAFQQGATHAGDSGIEAARAWLVNPANIGALRDDQARGYIANWDTAFNAQTFNWANTGTLPTTDSAGNAIQYVIHRLCRNSGESINAPTQQCVTITSTGSGSALDEKGFSGTVRAYYRITARVTGPRNTVSYVQSTMY